MSHTVRVIAWDDPRCTDPLKAAARIWRGGRGIDVHTRPLTAFNDQPLDELVKSCDVMVIDHPHVPQAVRHGAILPLNSLLHEHSLAALKADSLGACYESYCINGRPYATAADAACQVSAHRPHVLASYNVAPPRTWEEVWILAENHPGSVALPLYPSDAISCLMSLSAGQNAAPDGGDTMFPDKASALRAVELLRRVSALVDETCWKYTPPMLFAAVNRSETIAYIPLTFGYARMTHATEGNWRFGSPPVGTGSVLGGAGMAVSAASPRPEAAAEFIAWYAQAEVQTFLTMHGAQPASRLVWHTPLVNDAVGYFFSDTYRTIRSAYTRPLVPWWPGVQEKSGHILVEGLRSGEGAEAIIERMEACYAHHHTHSQEVPKK
ncbi:MAG: extracellular solute-binding protein [Spirochaetales bacterium]|nr:extracellular solute-binding protein [Spirochaetales bacterium]